MGIMTRDTRLLIDRLVVGSLGQVVAIMAAKTGSDYIIAQHVWVVGGMMMVAKKACVHSHRTVYILGPARDIRVTALAKAFLRRSPQPPDLNVVAGPAPVVTVWRVGIHYRRGSLRLGTRPCFLPLERHRLPIPHCTGHTGFRDPIEKEREDVVPHRRVARRQNDHAG